MLAGTTVPTALTLLALLVSGCSEEETPPPVAGTSSTDETPTDQAATSDPTAESPEPSDEPAVLDFGGESGASIDCDDDPSPVWVTVAHSVEANQEVRLGEVTVAGAGRLIGDVSIAAVGRGPDSGAMAVDEEPGYGDDITDRPAWAERSPVGGVVVQPGRHLVFAQVRVRPGSRLDGLDFAWSDGNVTGSDRLVMPVKVARQCPAD